MTEKRVRILRTLWLNGPNIWTYRSCIETLIDIQALEQYPSNLLPGFNERLNALLPGLAEHRCGIGEPGGFLLRLRDGTYAAHILEHIVIELHTQAGLSAGFGKARETSQSGVYKMVFRTPDYTVGLACLDAAVRLLHACIENTLFDLSAELKHIQRVVGDHGLGPSTQHIVDAAYERRIPTLRLNDGNLVQIGHGCTQQRIWTAETSKTSAIAESIASDKPLCKELLSHCGIPVPQGEVVASADEAWQVAQGLESPWVVKPTDANHGRGVSLELRTEADIRQAYEVAKAIGSGVMVEQYIAGTEHRVLVVNHQVVAASRGELVYVVGNGQDTVQQLVESQVNSDPLRGWEECYPLDPIDFEYEQTALLDIRRQGVEPHSVVHEGKQVLVQRNSNATVDVTDDIHPEIARLCVLAARMVELDIAGLDLICENIAQNPHQQPFAVVEVNAGPGLLMHIKPVKGTPRNVGRPIVEMLFPTVHPKQMHPAGRIPTVSYTGGAELADLGPALMRLFEDKGERVALACDQGLWMNGMCIQSSPSATWQAGRDGLTNTSTDLLLMQVHPATILQEGLPFDRSSVAIVTHLGQLQGLEAWDILKPEQLFNVTRTLVDLVLPMGHAILNADEPALLPLHSLCDGTVVWLTQNPEHPVVAEHITNGGMALLLHDHTVQFLGPRATQQGRHPITLPAPACQVPLHTLALAACAWVHNVPQALLRAELLQANPAIAQAMQAQTTSPA